MQGEPLEKLSLYLCIRRAAMACSNYRGISVLIVLSKVYAKILDSWLRRRTCMVMEVQGGFRSGRSCVDQCHTIRQLSEKIIGKISR